MINILCMGILALGAVAQADELELDMLSGGVLGKFRNTNYYVVLEEDYAKLPVDTDIRDMRGDTIARVSLAFRKATDIEGTGKLVDGRIINYAGRIDGEIRYLVTNAPWGLGVGTCQLVPFHSIAVDPKKIPLGSLVKIDETVGMELPDGTRHDGLWRADDVGGAIKQDRVDLFIGTRSQESFLVKAGITHLRALTIRMVEPPTSSSCVHLLLDELQN